MNTTVCCFSGYRPEKMPPDMREGSAGFADMQRRLRCAIREAAAQGCRHFLSGMSRGFDLWAADAVLELAEQGMPIDLWAAIAFPGMQDGWEPRWRAQYERVLRCASHVFPLYERYTPNCYTVRDRFLVEQSGRCICFYDGVPGGTQYTVTRAARAGLPICNLADRQLKIKL